MARNTIQSTNYDFTVERVPMTLPTGTQSRMYAHVRTDTGEELGHGTEQYGIIQNRDFVDMADETFDSLGMAPTSRRVVVCGRGERLYVQYDFSNDRAPVSRANRQVGDELGMRLTLQNSFDRSLRASVALGMLRLVCLNGMTTMENEFGMTRKHSSNVELGFIAKAINQAKASFQDAAKGFELLGERDITQDQGRNILNQLNKTNVLSNVVRDGIVKIWENPTHEEDAARNLWTLYNATTQHLTHAVSEDRFEYSNTVSTNVLRRLRGAASYPDKLAKLITAVPTDVIKNN